MPFISILTLAILLPLLHHLHSLHTNFHLAKLTGLPVLLAPLDPHGTFWQLASHVFAPLLHHFEWCRILSTTWTWQDGARHHLKYGPTFIVASPARNIVFTCDELAVAEVLKKWKTWVKPSIYQIRNPPPLRPRPTNPPLHTPLLPPPRHKPFSQLFLSPPHPPPPFHLPNPQHPRSPHLPCELSFSLTMASLPVDQFSHGSSLRRGVDLQRRDLCGVGRGPENLSWDEVFAGGVYGGVPSSNHESYTLPSIRQGEYIDP
ncbi:hypothetical protein GRF29_96g1526248 [Pseudopithomyces chartarum]|uniref:Uncharacterized protein n=1 Tax=Pseudopithomyces chartarum TaxID=1892770 RepID=A0AAN6LXW8_9PLEO|nr:hypothetical protein GRF29_96g1526248 [Pseudopithomyces chartarum]